MPRFCESGRAALEADQSRRSSFSRILLYPFLSRAELSYFFFVFVGLSYPKAFIVLLYIISLNTCWPNTYAAYIEFAMEKIAFNLKKRI